MIEFDNISGDITITKHGDFVKIPINDGFVEFIIGGVLDIDFNNALNCKGELVRRSIHRVSIDRIRAIKFCDGTLKKLEDDNEN